MKALSALFAGVLFGAGLLLSGMTDPANVLGFLDIFGAWRPQLALVMAAAVVIAAPAFYWVRTRQYDLFGHAVAMPDRRRLDGRLVGGAILFGIGWGASGICPGPALLLLASGAPVVFLFVAAMFAGMWAVSWRGSSG